jgi:GAF domain-containing protein
MVHGGGERDGRCGGGIALEKEDTVAKDRDDEIAELRRQLDAEVGRLNRLVEVTGQLSSTLSLEELLGLILSTATELLDAETSSLFLLDEETGELTVEVAAGEPADTVVQQRVPAGEGIAGWVVANEEPAVVEDPAADERFYHGIDEKTGFETRNLLAAPMRTRERVIGVIEIINKRSGAFVDRDVEVAVALAGQAGIAIDNARLYSKLADAVVTSRLSYRL